MDFIPGIYEHYKGGEYLAMGLAHKEDDGVVMVVYVQLSAGQHNPTKALQFVRPLKEWGQFVTKTSPLGDKGSLLHIQVPRFKLLRPIGP